MTYQTYRPFWILYPLPEKILSFRNNDWAYFTGDSVREGDSPLGENGEPFLNLSMQEINAFSNCFWVFPNVEFEDSSSTLKYTKLYSNIVKCVTGCMVSKQGLVITSSDIIHNQPPTPISFEHLSVSPVTTCVLNEIADLTELVWSLPPISREHYAAIFDYLAEIRKSALFISQQALWSFLEHRWANNKGNSSHASSLDGLLKTVYPDKDMRKEKKEWKEKIFNIGVELGKEYDEKHLRNMLAHGKHMSLQDGWSKSQWTMFIDVHSDLLQLVIKGLKVDIENEHYKG